MTEGLAVVLDDGIPDTGVGAFVQRAGTSRGDAGDEVLGAAALDGFQSGLGAVGLGPAVEVNQRR